MKKYTTLEFITKVNEIHKNKYSYEKSVYINNTTELIITCKTHGDFEQRPTDHLQGCGCPYCAGNIKKTNEKFAQEANIIHNNKFDYSLVNYESNHENIIIICPTHGIFHQLPKHHLNGEGCPECAYDNFRMTKKEFINRSFEKNGDVFDYSLVVFKKNSDLVTLICKKHKYEFKRTVSNILEGVNCPLCSGRVNNTEELIYKCNIVHNNKYSYLKTIYKNTNEIIIVTCKEHGDFEVTPKYHIQGRGCLKCLESKNVYNISKYLDDNNIKYVKEYKFNDCKYINVLRFDFFLPDYNCCIEYDGQQHFRASKRFGGEENLKIVKIRDSIKDEYCKNNNIKLIRISYLDNIYEKLNLII
jgi:hypothetical protein